MGVGCGGKGLGGLRMRCDGGVKNRMECGGMCIWGGEGRGRDVGVSEV